MFKIIQKNDMNYNKFGSFICTFYCKTEYGCFPFADWTDFGMNILTWWIEAYLNCTKEHYYFQLPFEDGPFWIDCYKVNDLVTMSFSSDRDAYVVMPSIEIDFHELGKELLNAGEKMQFNLFEGGHLADVQSISTVLNRLKTHCAIP